MVDPGRTVALVLAAGSASRFGSPKLLAPLAGRPVLGHVLALAGRLGLAGPVLVLGDEASAIESAVARLPAVDPAGRTDPTIVRNPDPGAGLSSSLRIGLEAVAARFPDAAAAAVLLGDEPFVEPRVVEALLAAAGPSGRPIVVPRYAGGGGPNPVLLLRAAWPIASGLRGDRGMGPVIAAHPELVHEVRVEGEAPRDVDTPVDLALAAWAARVRADREQVDRCREVPDGRDFYGPVSAMFRADPERIDDPQLDRLLELARPDDVWVDIGAGAGRFALPLARRVREVIAVDPSDGMLEALGEAMVEHRIPNIRVIHGRWPLAPAEIPPEGPPVGDVALIAHLGYDIEEIGPFLEAMENAARRVCVAVLMDRQPSASVEPFWPPIHGEARVALPGLGDLVELLRLCGRSPEVVRVERPRRAFESLDALTGFARRQLWIAEGGAKDRRLAQLAPTLGREIDGRWYLEGASLGVGVVTWAPHGDAIDAGASSGPLPDPR